MEAEQISWFVTHHNDTDMERLKKILFITSFACCVIGFAASIWVYTVQPDTESLIMMVVLLLATIGTGVNLKNLLKST